MLRRTGSPLDLAVRRHVPAGDVATADVVIMEVLAGSTPAAQLAGVRRAVDACAHLRDIDVLARYTELEVAST